MESLKSAEDCSRGFFEFICVFALAFMNCTHCYSFMCRPPVLIRATAPRMLTLNLLAPTTVGARINP